MNETIRRQNNNNWVTEWTRSKRAWPKCPSRDRGTSCSARRSKTTSIPLARLGCSWVWCRGRGLERHRICCKRTGVSRAFPFFLSFHQASLDEPNLNVTRELQTATTASDNCKSFSVVSPQIKPETTECRINPISKLCINSSCQIYQAPSTTAELIHFGCSTLQIGRINRFPRRPLFARLLNYCHAKKAK